MKKDLAYKSRRVLAIYIVQLVITVMFISIIVLITVAYPEAFGPLMVIFITLFIALAVFIYRLVRLLKIPKVLNSYDEVAFYLNKINAFIKYEDIEKVEYERFSLGIWAGFYSLFKAPYGIIIISDSLNNYLIRHVAGVVKVHSKILNILSSSGNDLVNKDDKICNNLISLL